MRHAHWISTHISPLLLAIGLSCSGEPKPEGASAVEEVAAPIVLADVLRLAEPLSAEQVDALMAWTEEEAPEIQAAAATILYRHDPVQYWPQLFAAFTIRDYLDREQGIYHFIPVEDMGAKVDEIEAQYPRDELHPASIFLYTFLHYRDLNQWTETKRNPRLSIARFFRGAYLANMLKGDVGVEAANRIDAETKAAMLA